MSTYRRSIAWTAVWELTKTGKKEAIATMKYDAESPTPNQTIASGIHAIRGLGAAPR